jgi:hypothetical protein
MVNTADYLLMDHAFALHGGALSPAMLSERESRFGQTYVTDLLTSVPEPADIFLILIPIAALSIPRRDIKTR